MQSAARGSLSVPSAEMIEILVYLSLHHKILGEQARLTLAGWDEKVCLLAAQDPGTSVEVLGYWASPQSLRIPLLPSLAGNPSVTDALLHEIAAQGARSALDILLASRRVMNSPALLKALQSNAALRPNELKDVADKLAAFAEAGVAPPAGNEATTPPNEGVSVPEAEIETAINAYLKENAAAIEAEKDKPFRPVGDGEFTLADTASPQAAGPPANSPPAATPAAKVQKAALENPVERRDSTMQKIAKLDVKGRIALAMRGNKEERSILIRDSTKIISLAVLDSPKVSDAEVEAFAQQRNVLDAVLRTIPMKRRFAKKYTILRNLVFNPRTPIDSSLALMKGLMTKDLKALIENKDVPEAVRKLAHRMHAQKMERHK
jgi:hypothetical protein